MGFSRQAQVVQPNRREDLDGLEPLLARLEGTLASGRQVEQAVLGQLEGLFADRAGGGARLHQRDHFFSQRLLGIAAARLHAEALHQEAFSPGDAGLHAFGDPDHRKLGGGYGLARLQAGGDLGMGDIPLPPLDVVLLDDLLVDGPPPVTGGAAGKAGDQHPADQQNQQW